MFVAGDLAPRDKSIALHLEKKAGEELEGYEQSGKLMGLVDKLVECEIIERGEESKHQPPMTPQDDNLILVDISPAETLRKHRALIFC